MDERGTPSLSVLARVFTAPHTVESHQLQCWLKQCGEVHLMPNRVLYIVAQKPLGADAAGAVGGALDSKDGASAAASKYAAGARPIMVRELPDKDKDTAPA